LVAFGKEGNRDALLRASKPGDRVVFVGTQGEPTVSEERGRLLGMAEFARIAVNTRDIVDPGLMQARDLNEDGAHVWGWALPMVRAWRFTEPRLKLIDVLREQLSYEATVRAVLLNEADTGMVMALPNEEVPVTANARVRGLTEAVDAIRGIGPTTGLTPTSWEGGVSHDATREAWTYAMRFGRRNIWKVGHAQDVEQRLRQINLHVPHEELGERWEFHMRQRWPDSVAAFGMEQRVFEAMKKFRTEGERMRCTEKELLAAWAASLQR
jgi:hypothetical protein